MIRTIGKEILLDRQHGLSCQGRILCAVPPFPLQTFNKISFQNNTEFLIFPAYCRDFSLYCLTLLKMAPIFQDKLGHSLISTGLIPNIVPMALPVVPKVNWQIHNYFNWLLAYGAEPNIM